MAHEDTGAHLAGGLPEYYPAADTEGNYKLLKSIADEFDSNEVDIDDVNDSVFIQNANSFDELREHGKMVNTLPNDGESLEHYRARVLVEYLVLSSNGTIMNIINSAAELIDVDNSDIGYAEPIVGSSENGTASVSLPASAISDSALTESEVGEFTDRVAPGGVRIEGLITGTFEYISVTNYNNDNHDADKGYNGLDANGDPKDNGGTYSGLIA